MLAIAMFDEDFDLEMLVQETSLRHRTQFRNAQVAKQETVEQQSVAQDLGWSAANNAHLCKLNDGSIVAADSISSSSGTGLVSVSRSAQGRPLIKSPL